MGMQKVLLAQNNGLKVDFPNAYWRIENIIFSTEGADFYVSFQLHAYASYESASNNDEVTPLGVGTTTIYSTVLYKWNAIEKWSVISTGLVPITEEGQKSILYPFIKSQVPYLSDAIDVLEE